MNVYAFLMLTIFAIGLWSINSSVTRGGGIFAISSYKPLITSYLVRWARVKT